MAIETVYLHQNTSIIPDEMWAHRVGLVPIKADPQDYQFKQVNDEANDTNTIVFNLHVKCERNPKASPQAMAPEEKYLHSSVTSKDMVWQPVGTQEGKAIGPVLDDILLGKLRPGQEVELTLHCHKGRGSDHAKWSPVGTASYRLLPDIVLKEPIEGDDADLFVACFPRGVARTVMKKGRKVAQVVDPRKCTMSREVLRHPSLADKVSLGRRRDHFIFTVESTGVLAPEAIVMEGLKVFINKCELLAQALDMDLHTDLSADAPTTPTDPEN